VVAETERLSRLVNQVLDMAKIESGHADWHNADVDLGRCWSRRCRPRPSCSASAARNVHLHCPAEVPTLRADPDRLLQVVLNLLSNAAKFVPRQGGRVSTCGCWPTSRAA
jgi:signal transduction histidine kinase